MRLSTEDTRAGGRLKRTCTAGLLACLGVLASITVSMAGSRAAGASTPSGSGSATAAAQTTASSAATDPDSDAESATLPALGVNDHALGTSTFAYPEEYKVFSAAGASWVRVDAYWASFEPELNTYNSAYLLDMDAVVQTAQADGLKVLFVVVGTPPWDVAAGSTAGESSPPVNLQDFGNAMQTLATRYSPSEVAWEIWNEPDVQSSGLNPAFYTQLVCAAYSAIKSVSSSYTVVAGALSWPNAAWLGQAYAAGLGGCSDAISVHVYVTPPASNAPGAASWSPTFSLAGVEGVMSSYGDANKPVWITEFGFSSSTASSEPAGAVTLADQAFYTEELIQYVANTFPGVPVMMAYEGMDDAALAVPTYEQNYGLLSHTLVPKPVMSTLASLYGGTAPTSTWSYTVPAITGISPSSDTTAGGTTVTITGTGFTGAYQVLFGSVPATSYTVASDTEITAVSPPETTAVHDIYVTAPGGESATVAADEYTYTPPAVTAVYPASGITSGGTTVTITGTGFTGASGVLFGSVPATSYTVVSDTEITAVSPPQTAAFHDIFVMTLYGTSAPVTADEFSYIPPNVTGVSQQSGTTAGGTTVKITGTGFTAADGVFFGTVPATAFTVLSGSDITAVSPPEPADTHNIFVTTVDGSSAPAPADEFTYTPPGITKVSPDSGTTGGGTTITITGARFDGVTKVLFGAVAATNFKVVTNTEITAVSPAETQGTHNIFMSTVDGTSPMVTEDTYTFTPPIITSVSPDSGTTGGGTTVTITGTGFIGTTKVSFGAVATTSFTVISNTEMTAVSPPENAGWHNIFASKVDGTSAAATGDRFTYLNPVIYSVSPDSGTTGGGTTVTIIGSGFTGATQILFGAVAAASFTLVSSTEIIAVSPPEPSGTHNIFVSMLDGRSAKATADQFTYDTPLR